MATNTGEGYREGSVKERTQTQNDDGTWVKRDRESGEFMDVKEADDEPFKGVAEEEDARRN